MRGHTCRWGVTVALVLLSGCGDAPTRGPDANSDVIDGPSLMSGTATQAAPKTTEAVKETTAIKTFKPASYKSVTIEKIPHVRQKPDFCGEACAEMALRRLGQRGDQDFVFDQSGLSPLEGRGCYTRELAPALRAIGFKTGPVWHKVTVRQASAQLETLWAAVHNDLLKGIPSIVCMHYNDQPETTEHFRLITGYDASGDEVIYHEPAIAQGAYQRMKRSDFMKLWPLKYDRDQWSVIVMRLEPARLRKAPTATTFTNADYCQHIRELKKRLPADDYHIVLQPPFVVVGNESKEAVERRASGTVKWAVDRLKRNYFDKNPNEILDIWLFRDKKTYNQHATKLFGRKPTTPFGYYSATDRALVMNISTGGGTLVHEIVHPFVAANFPQCPSWLNEGMGSLYEQCGDRNGSIWGFTNWRLAGLQRAIRAETVPSFKTLCSTTRNGFYNKDPGTNYSQARYLCYYLQEKGLLMKYFHQFRKGWKDDPTGYETLQAVLGKPEMDKFQQDWEEYVLKLEFP